MHATADAVYIEEAAAARWLDEVATTHEDAAAGWLQLVDAARRDLAELLDTLPAHVVRAHAGAHMAAMGVEALLDRLRTELSAVAGTHMATMGAGS